MITIAEKQPCAAPHAAPAGDPAKPAAIAAACAAALERHGQVGFSDLVAAGVTAGDLAAHAAVAEAMLAIRAASAVARRAAL